jgi:cytoskeleton protein RodZ
MNFDLAGIGRILRERREEKRLSVAQISDILCLRKALIEAIEAGDWGPLPHEVYVKGFVKKYASILHVHDEVAAFFEAPVEQEKEEKIVEVVAPVSKSPKPPRPVRRTSRARIAYLLGLVIVVFCFFAYDRMERNKTVNAKTETAQRIAETSQPQQQATNVRPVSEVSTVSETGNQEEKSSLSAMSEPKRLMITCHERTWISAVIDGSEKKEFMLSPHEIIVLNAKERFDLLIGNAGGVKLILNGKDTEFTGNSGEVKRIDLS